jgi:hypothetical protein
MKRRQQKWQWSGYVGKGGSSDSESIAKSSQESKKQEAEATETFRDGRNSEKVREGGEPKLKKDRKL